MYGIVNKAIEGLVVESFGIEKWNEVKLLSQVEEERFLSHEQYDDSITFKLAIAASQVLKLSLEDVLVEFGKYWVIKTAKKHYGSLMDSGGHSFKEFIINLPNFHSRVMLIYPNIKPPEFKISDISDSSLILHYYSTREGLTYFVKGLIVGLSELFHHSISLKLLKSKSEGADHDEFLISF